MKRGIKGFALVAAIFLLVVLGLLGFYLLSLSGTQTFTGLWAVQGSRALYAARSGVQWGAVQALSVGDCSATPPAVNAGAPVNFTLIVTCNSTDHDELGVATKVWEISATARMGNLGDPGFVQRTVVTTVTEVTAP